MMTIQKYERQRSKFKNNSFKNISVFFKSFLFPPAEKEVLFYLSKRRIPIAATTAIEEETKKMVDRVLRAEKQLRRR